jgi:hypothetical protein
VVAVVAVVADIGNMPLQLEKKEKVASHLTLLAVGVEREPDYRLVLVVMHP